MSNIDHPSHYNAGNIEIIDAIEDWKLEFSLGCVIKYVARADHKDDPIEDLQKAAWYLNREINRRLEAADMFEGICCRPETMDCQTVKPGGICQSSNCYHWNEKVDVPEEET